MNSATRYAKAWMDETLEKGSIEEALSDIETLMATLDGSRDLDLFLKNPIHSRLLKKSILVEIFAGKVSEETIKLIELLILKGRVGELYAICQTYKSLHQKASDIVEAEITSALELTQKDLESLKEALQSSLGKTVVPSLNVDPSIIGGIKVRIADQVVDGSVKHQLDVLRKRFTVEEA